MGLSRYLPAKLSTNKLGTDIYWLGSNRRNAANVFHTWGNPCISKDCRPFENPAGLSKKINVRVTIRETPRSLWVRIRPKTEYNVRTTSKSDFFQKILRCRLGLLKRRHSCVDTYLPAAGEQYVSITSIEAPSQTTKDRGFSGVCITNDYVCVHISPMGSSGAFPADTAEYITSTNVRKLNGLATQSTFGSRWRPIHRTGRRPVYGTRWRCIHRSWRWHV